MSTESVKIGWMLKLEVTTISRDADSKWTECFQTGRNILSHFLQNDQKVGQNTKRPEADIPQVMSKKYYTLEDVSEHCDSSSCWIVKSDKVYDVTKFINEHPGGEEIILEHAGCDATIPYESKGHSAEANAIIEKYCIGQLVEADRRYKKK